MADFLTHILLADSVSKQIESRRIYEGVTKKHSLYYLGAQGHAPLFSYNYFSGSRKDPFRCIGEVIHTEKTSEFLKNGFERLRNVSYDENWLDLSVFLCGFICNFTLDRMIHPYVYWATEHWIWGVDGTPHKVTHQQIEAALDVILWKEAKSVPACEVRTQKLTDVGQNLPKSIILFLRDTFKDLYGVELDENKINKILKGFYRGHDLLFDPRGWKKTLINWLESFTGGGIKPPKYPYPVEADPTIDWANRKKRTWTNPFVEGENSNLSLDELVSIAANTASNHINTIFARIYRNEYIDDLFPSYSYLTGLIVK